MKAKSKKTQDKQPNYNAPKDVARSGDSNEGQVMGAIERHNQTPMPMLFNRPERKLVQQHMVEELSQGFEHRRKALNMVLETKLHSIQEACNHVLVTGKTHLRQQRLEYFGEVFREVEQRMNGLADAFLTDMDKRFERLKEFKSEAIKKREKQRLDKSVDDFLDTLDQLMDEFRSIISEHISHSKEKSEALKQDENKSRKHQPEPQTEHQEKPKPTPQTTREMSNEEYENEFGINDVVDQFMEAQLRDKF